MKFNHLQTRNSRQSIIFVSAMIFLSSSNYVTSASKAGDYTRLPNEFNKIDIMGPKESKIRNFVRNQKKSQNGHIMTNRGLKSKKQTNASGSKTRSKVKNAPTASPTVNHEQNSTEYGIILIPKESNDFANESNNDDESDDSDGVDGSESSKTSGHGNKNNSKKDNNNNSNNVKNEASQGNNVYGEEEDTKTSNQASSLKSPRAAYFMVTATVASFVFSLTIAVMIRSSCFIKKKMSIPQMSFLENEKSPSAIATSNNNDTMPPTSDNDLRTYYVRV